MPLSEVRNPLPLLPFVNLGSVDLIVVNFSKGNATEQEAPHVIEDARPPREWPSQGEITFHDVSMSYRPGLPKVLRDISMEVCAGEKIGIVGRTGAGKSSLILALLRIVEFEGTITVDGYVLRLFSLEK